MQRPKLSLISETFFVNLRCSASQNLTMYRSIVIFQMKQTTIVGNIGRDAVCREGDGGHKFVSFSVAYAERKTNDTDEQGNPVTVAQWAECEIYVGPESSAEGLLKLLTKGRFIYIEASDKVEAWIDKNNQVRSRILYRVTNFQV